MATLAPRHTHTHAHTHPPTHPPTHAHPRTHTDAGSATTTVTLPVSVTWVNDPPMWIIGGVDSGVGVSNETSKLTTLHVSEDIAVRVEAMVVDQVLYV